MDNSPSPVSQPVSQRRPALRITNTAAARGEIYQVSDLIVVLGDQLSVQGTALETAHREHDRVLMMEVEDESRIIPHHKHKIVLFLSAMRHFAAGLRADGWSVDYVKLDDPGNQGSFASEIARAVARHKPDRLVITHPGEYRVRHALKTAFPDLVEVADTRFIAPLETFQQWAEGRKSLRLEYFYRLLRRQTGLLMSDDRPEGGQWNYDADNRAPADPDQNFAPPKRFAPDAITRSVMDLVEARFGDHMGSAANFSWPVTRAEAQAALDDFITHRLPHFGATQDAMLTDEPFLNHSLISSSLNLGLLDPLEVCHRAKQAYLDGSAPLNAVEGFIRQVLGWREYVRGLYWHTMPAYQDRNALGANRPLPAFYWTGETELACLRAAISQTIAHGYAHHIQRLMITGTFALLIGADAKDVHEWYLAVYVDALEWVELPNTLGMSQFADGGMMASKPYAASGQYIKRMSNYCNGCRYKVSKRTGPDACPFNALYWDFVARHEDVLQANPRMGPVYRTWHRMDDAKQTALRASAADFLGGLA